MFNSKKNISTVRDLFKKNSPLVGLIENVLYRTGFTKIVWILPSTKTNPENCAKSEYSPTEF